MIFFTDKLIELAKDLRFERKFVVSELMTEEIETLLKIHHAVFKEIYHKRTVNNIYLDTHDLRLYRDNIDGKNDRCKIRVRWYGKVLGRITEPYLEIKIKKGNCGFKLKYLLNDFVLDNKFSSRHLQSLFIDSNIPDFLKEYLKDLRMSIINSYDRKYYLSCDRNFRITIDSEMRFYRAHQRNNNFLVKSALWHDKIIEIKYNSDLDHKANKISAVFPFSLFKHSKYVRGIEELGF